MDNAQGHEHPLELVQASQLDQNEDDGKKEEAVPKDSSSMRFHLIATPQTHAVERTPFAVRL